MSTTYQFDEVGRLPLPGDNVAITTRRLEAGTTIVYRGTAFTLEQTILEGHRFAIQPIAPGEPLLSWELPFGIAIRPIALGDYVINESALHALRDRTLNFSLPAERVVRSLNQIIEWRGKPLAIRVDNGPEYVSSTLMTWAEKPGIALTYIQPGKPQQNAYVERYNRTVRHEWLDLYIFETIEEVQQIATEWLWTYNNERPNMGIGGVTPAMKLKMAA